ncbi:hypothetical protein MKW92_007738 [Papaver armeniacum]|nr:hypothetical protein MKW92_007738 [Papaver armeniacum]
MGDVENARLIFDEAPFKDRGIWGCMISRGVGNVSYDAGMASKGLQIFNSMNFVYGIEPKSEHYGCMINLLAGSPSDEAMAWRALLSSCCSHGETGLAEVAAERLVQRTRKNMKERGVVKTPGCSSIEVNGFIHEFVAGEKTHPQMQEIHKVLEKMNDQLE